MMLTFADLLTRNCRHIDGPPMEATAVVSQLAAAGLPWRHVDGSLVREFRFRNYYETLAFVNALAFIVHAQDHHPDLAVSFNRCEVRFNTHSVGGISENDFICAAKIDALWRSCAGAGA
jgi:4a-hydroxytetrahydrobiopterin dehydratase